MGSSSKQTTGYRYFSNFLLFIGNPIEKLLGINFDKRGWQNPLVDENQSALEVGTLNLPNLYGENEGGVAGKIYAQYGTDDQPVVPFYKSYMDAQDLPASAFPYQSYLAFTGLGEVPVGGWAGSIIGSMQGQYNSSFYLGNSGYMKEMLLWPKRIHVRNDGRSQWYDAKAEIPTVSSIEHLEQMQKNIEFNIYRDQESMFRAEAQPSQNYTIPCKTKIDGKEIIYSFNHSPGSGTNGSGKKLSYTQQLITCSNSDLEFDLTFSIKTNTQMGLDIEFNVGHLISIESSENDLIKTYSGVWDAYVNPVLRIKASTYGQYTTGDTSLVVSIALSNARVSSRFIGDSGDINPIHKIREILTDDTAMNKPESDVNNVNFMKAAERIWDEGLGISWSITEKSCLDAINELCGHIEAGVRVNRQTGLYEVVLFRDDWFEENEIHTLAVNKIKSMSLDVSNADEAINQLNVSYYNRESIKDSSFSVAENASIRNLNGRVNAEDADFPYFMNQRNAAVVAQWKLKQMSSTVWSGSFTTAAYEARKWNRYDLLKVAWPRKWQGTITVRIMKINLGTGTDVSIDFVEVMPYSSNLSSNIVIDTPIDIAPLPPLPCQYEPFELPYYLAVMALGQRQVDDELIYENNYGLVGVVAEKPQNNSLYAVMMTHDGTEGEEWLRAATVDYEATADLDQIISKTSTNLTLKNSSAIANVAAGTLIKCGSDWIGTPGEWMVFQGIDPYTGVVSVKRGALDSLPQAWGINTKFYFCGNDVAYDQTEYIAGEEVFVSALTTTPSGMLENKGSIGIEMNARAFRPYPPANVQLNGYYFPDTHVISNDVVLTWKHRNRLQQTGGEILGWFDGGVTSEAGVSYSLELSTVQDGLIHSASSITADTYTIPASVLKQNLAHKLKIWSVRDGFTSHQSLEHNFFVESVSLILTASVTKDNANGSTLPAANISVNVDESLKANMRFDGTRIGGKAPAGSVITIEIED